MNLPDAQKLMIKQGQEIMDALPKFTMIPQSLKYLEKIEEKYPNHQKKWIDTIIANQWKKKQKSGYKSKNKLMKVYNEVVIKEYHIYATHPSEFKDCKACRIILNFFKWQKKSIAPPWTTQPGPPKDTYSSPKWAIYDGQLGAIIDDPPTNKTILQPGVTVFKVSLTPGIIHCTGKYPDEYCTKGCHQLVWKEIAFGKPMITKSTHSKTCTCKICEELGSGAFNGNN